nr:integrase, catalytic region, zinc finger, CCHC-type, peptidase aspartic, catalytic [Tanacetum cinerariifolium]
MNPKLYDASYLYSSNVCANVCDNEEIIEEATKSQLKMKEKLEDPIAIEKKLNFLKFIYDAKNAPRRTAFVDVEDSILRKFCYDKTQKEINELIESFNQKMYAYGDVRSQNQDILITISELKAKLKDDEKGLKVVNSVKRPSTRSSSSKNSVLSNTKIHSEVVEVYVKKNKKTSVTSQMNVVKTKKHVENVDTKNALKVNVDVLCVSYDKNMLTPCHDKCLAKYKLFVDFKVRLALFTTPRNTKSKSANTTPVVAKTSGYSKHMAGNLKLLRNLVEKFMGTVRFENDHFAAIT